MQSIKALSEQTGLTVSYIRKCIDCLQTTLQPYLHRGNHNAILIDSNGVVLFDKIKQLKEQGLALPDIKTQIETTLKEGQTKGYQPIKTPESPAQKIDTQFYVERLLETQQLLNEEKDRHFQEIREKEEQFRFEKDRHIEESKEKDQTIFDLTRKAEALTMTLNMLPEGKNPEDIRKDYEQQQRAKQEAARILGELKTTTGVFKGRRRKELLEQLEKLLF